MRLFRAYAALFFAIVEAFRIPRVQALLLICLLLVVAQAVVFSLVEGWRFLDAVYFAVVSMSTVGYGDLTPETSLGKVLAMAFLLFGIGFFVLTVSLIAQAVLHELFLSDGITRRPDPDHDKE